MNLKKTFIIIAPLVLWLAILTTCPDSGVNAHALSERSGHPVAQESATHTPNPAAPALPVSTRLSAAEIQSHPSDAFRLSILIKNSTGEPARGANVFISRSDSSDEALEMLRTDESGRAVLDLSGTEFDLLSGDDPVSDTAPYWISAAWINPQDGIESLQAIAELTFDHLTPVEFVVAAGLSPVDTSAPTDIRTNPCYRPGQLNTHLIDVLWSTTEHPERRSEDQAQIGELERPAPAAQPGVVRVSNDPLDII